MASHNAPQHPKHTFSCTIKISFIGMLIMAPNSMNLIANFTSKEIFLIIDFLVQRKSKVYLQGAAATRIYVNSGKPNYMS